MVRVVVAETARRDLDNLIAARSLPLSTRDRVRRSIEPLGTFPLLGPALEGRWSRFRVIVGPWPWMLIVYLFDESADVVTVVTIQDARTTAAPRSTP